MEHLQTAPELAAGLKALPRTATAFASTQAAWRFLANPRVTLPQLVAPLHAAARQAFPGPDAGYALVVHDWSSLNYPTHARKRDQATLSHDRDRGYELACALLVETTAGRPVAPLELRLRTADAVSSTRTPAPATDATRPDELLPTMRAVAALGLPATLVHVIDREADSVGHYRDWHADGRLFLVRADDARRVRWGERAVLLPLVAAGLVFTDSREVEVRGRKARQWVAEAAVVLDRPAKPKRARGGGPRRPVPGAPLPLRLVVSQVREESGAVLAEWLLLTNVPAAVPAAEVALWYYWRWRIESFFRLLKSAGQQVERWQQETGAAMAKRLLVAAMACVVVWQLARSREPAAAPLRRLLVRLSGRQMGWGVEFTEPALLAGLMVLVPVLELLTHHDLGELRRLAQQALPILQPPNSS
jgi:hypothetical protein